MTRRIDAKVAPIDVDKSRLSLNTDTLQLIRETGGVAGERIPVQFVADALLNG